MYVHVYMYICAHVCIYLCAIHAERTRTQGVEFLEFIVPSVTVKT